MIWLTKKKKLYVKRMMYELEDEIEDEVEVVAISRQWILFI